MANEEQQHGAVSIGEMINDQIATKIDYLQQLQTPLQITMTARCTNY